MGEYYNISLKLGTTCPKGLSLVNFIRANVPLQKLPMIWKTSF